MKLNDLPNPQPNIKMTEEQEKFFIAIVLISTATFGFVFSTWLGANQDAAIFWAIFTVFTGIIIIFWAINPHWQQTPPATIRKTILMNGIPVFSVPVFMQMGAWFYSFIAAGFIYYCLKYYFKQAEKNGGRA